MRRRTFITALPAAFAVGHPASAQAPSGAGDAREALERLGRVQVEFTRRALAVTLESALVRSRDDARTRENFPIPPEAWSALSPFFPDAMLERVRYAVNDDVRPIGVAGLAIREGDAVAVTLIDTIVFRAEAYTQNLALWAHELAHVEQYEQWGVAGFAARYIVDWPGVEAAAEARSRAYVAWLEDRRRG